MVLAGCLALVALPAASQDPSLRLEALTERIAKLQAQLGQGVLAERSRRAQGEAMRDFEVALRAAAAGAPSAEARENYLLLGLLWQDYRGWALKPPSKENARRLADRAQELAWVAAKGARMAQEPGRKGTGRLALDAAHAATLSQRVARLHLIRRWGVRDASIDSQLGAATEGLRATLDKLRAATLNTPEVDAELQVAGDQLAFLLQAAKDMEGGRGTARQLEYIAKAGDNILESMQRVARLYEGLGA